MRDWRGADRVGRVALVSGGSRGLGLAIAGELARQGCRVVICARDGPELDRGVAHLARDGLDVLAQRSDVREPAQARAVVEQTVGQFGRLDMLVNNAGIIQVGPYETMRLDDYEQAVATMFWGPLHLTRAALPHLRDGGHGRIVNICSVGGRISVPHLLPYCCAKFAAVGLSEGLRAALARQGVSVTTVTPGLMRTGSDLHAVFAGAPTREFAWFSLAAGLPGISMDAERAARRIVAAAQAGRADLVLTPAAWLGVRLHGLAPGLTARALELMERLLPGAPPDGADTMAGMAAHQRLNARWLDTVTRLNRAAARRLNQLPDTPSR